MSKVAKAPLIGDRVCTQLRVGVDGRRVTDQGKHGDVVHRVGIRAALAEIEAFAGGQRPYRFGFGETVQRRYWTAALNIFTIP